MKNNKPDYTFNKRSDEKEIIDLGPSHYSAEEYQDCMEKMFKINKLLGFFSHTKKILKKFSRASYVLDIGCGNGAFVAGLSKYFPEKKFKGIDISLSAITIAKQKTNTNLSFSLEFFTLLTYPENSVDIILATLVCHHFTDTDIINFFQETYTAASQAVIINDLHRHSLAHWIYGILSPLLFRNRIITHDGLISIRRGFKRAELIHLLQKANIDSYSLTWRFPFRWSLILWKK